MVRIDCLIFGYRKIEISPEFLSDATSILLRASIPSKINADGTITVRERDFLKIQGLFRGRFEFEHSEPLGIAGKYKCLHNKTAYISAIIISLTLIVFLSNLVWDIRIEGNANIPDSDINIDAMPGAVLSLNIAPKSTPKNTLVKSKGSSKSISRSIFKILIYSQPLIIAIINPASIVKKVCVKPIITPGKT